MKRVLALAEKASAKLASGLLQHVISHVRVHIGRKPDRGVAQHCTHDLQRFALFHQSRGRRMPLMPSSA